MKSILDIIIPRHTHADIVYNQNPEQIVYRESDVIEATKEYALDVLNEVVENPANYINDVDMNSVLYGVIDVEAIDTLRKRIQDGTGE